MGQGLGPQGLWKYVWLGTRGAQAPWAMEGGKGQLLPSAAGAVWANSNNIVCQTVTVSQISYFNLPTWPTRPENSSASGFVIWLAALSVHRFPTNPEARDEAQAQSKSLTSSRSTKCSY